SGLCETSQRQLLQVKAQVAPFLQHCLESVRWEDYDVIGFTSLFEQNLASLSLGRYLKARYPEKIIVYGGPNFEDTMGQALHRSLPFIDFVCSGEADQTFPELIRRLDAQESVADLPGIIYRDNGRSVFTGAASITRDMD